MNLILNQLKIYIMIIINPDVELLPISTSFDEMLNDKNQK